MRRINQSKYKMVIANNIYVSHNSSQSSENSLKTQHIRKLNFMFGELVNDYKCKKIRVIKLLREPKLYEFDKKIDSIITPKIETIQTNK